MAPPSSRELLEDKFASEVIKPFDAQQMRSKTVTNLLSKYQSAVRRQDLNGVLAIISEGSELPVNEEARFLLEIININVPQIVIKCAERLHVLVGNASVDKNTIRTKVNDRKRVWGSHEVHSVVRALDRVFNAENSGRESPVRSPQHVGLDTVEFRNYIKALEAGRVAFSLSMNGKEAAGQLGFSQSFATLYDELIQRTKAYISRSGGIGIEKVIELAKSIANEQSGDTESVTVQKDDFETDFEKQVADFWQVLNTISDAREIDLLVEQFEGFVRDRLTKANRTEKDAISSLVAKALNTIDGMLIEKGFIVTQSPRGLSDEKWLVVYEADDSLSEVARTSLGYINIIYVRQVTRFADGLLRGNPGWSSFFNNYVVVFIDSIEQTDTQKNTKVLQGKLPFEAVDSISSKGRRINRMAAISRDMIQKGLGGLDRSTRRKVQLKATGLHELEHEVRRRMLKLKEGDRVYGHSEESIAELRSVLDSEEPWHVLAHIVELAAGGVEYAWSILSALSRQSDKDAILQWLESQTKYGTNANLHNIVQRTYAEAIRDWSRAYNFAGRIDYDYTVRRESLTARSL